MLSSPEQTADRRPPLVLVVDDEEWSARAFESVLSPHGHSVIRLRSARQTLERLQTISPDALLIKSDLPDLAASELCRAVRSQLGPSTPIFLVSAAPLRRAQRLEALTSGAWDLITLPLQADELLLRLNTYIDAKFETDRAREESLLDLGSGLYSIRGLLRRVRELTLEAYRTHGAIGCLVIGPEDDPSETPSTVEPAWVASRLIELINQAGRRSDAIGRLNQTDFVVVAPRTTAEGVLRMAQRLQSAAETLSVEEAGKQPLRIRFGCYAIDDFRESEVDPVQLLIRATTALRRAQRDVASEPICFFGQSYSVS